MPLFEDLIDDFESAPATGPVAPPILSIHRGLDGYVAFGRAVSGANQKRKGRKEKGDWENLFSIPVHELESMFPELREWLIADSYFSVNSYYTAAPYLNKLTGLPDVWRKTKYLRYLNACYVDLDVGRTTSTDPLQRRSWQQAIAAACQLMDEGTLPRASIFARSGQGLYIFWLLYDEKNPPSPPRFWQRKEILYKQINTCLQNVLKNQAADSNAVDCSRVLRTPGSLHIRAAKHVTYLFPVDENGRGYSYTLRELAKFFRVRLVQSSLPVEHGERVDPLGPQQYGRATLKPGSAPNRRKGKVELNRRRCEDLVCVEQFRGGWEKGTRYKRLKLYAQFLRGAGDNRSTTAGAIEIMAANCRPPYPSDRRDAPLEKIVSEVFDNPPKVYKNTTLVEWLGLTPEIEEILELTTIRSPAMALKHKLPAGGQRGIEREHRLQIMQQLCTEHGGLSARKMQQMLRNRGINVSHSTVNDELNQLGFRPTAPRVKRRPSSVDDPSLDQNPLPLNDAT